MKILLVSSWYPSSGNSVLGVFVREQAKALKRAGVNPIVFYPYDRSVPQNSITCSDEDGIVTYRANTDYLKKTSISRINSIIKTKNYIGKILKEHNEVKIVHAHVCYPAGFSTALYCRHRKIPFIITEHMSYIAKYSEKFYNNILFKYAYSNAASVITVSSFLKDEMIKLGYSFKSQIIGNVVDVEKSSDDSSKINIDSEQDNEYSMLFIGSMEYTEVKGLQYLIPAFAGFVKNNPGIKIKLSIIGDGAKRPDYENMCRDYKIEDLCSFYGKVDKERIPDYIARHDFLVSSSIKETFGSVLIEAMAQGKPVLATRCGGPSEFVNEKNGILVEPYSADELEKGIGSMIRELNNFDNKYIKQFAADNFSYEAVGEKLRSLYIELSGNDGEK